MHQIICYHLTICPVTTAIHTIHPQYLISPYYLSGHNSYTHHPSTDINALNSESSVLIYEAEGQSFRISLRNWLVTFLNTSLPLLYHIPIHYKLQNTKWSDELQGAQKIQFFPLMCELHVTVKIYRAARSNIDCWRRWNITYTYMKPLDWVLHVWAKGEKEIGKLFPQSMTTTERTLQTLLKS
jgi:hypothetical protein